MKREGRNLPQIKAALIFFLAFAVGPNAPAADFPQGLMLHFSFDQAEGNGSIPDRTGRNSNGRSFGVKWLPAGKQGGGCEFMVTNSYIQVTNSPALNMTQATFAVWFKTSRTNSVGRYIFDKQRDHGYAMGISGESSDKGKLCVAVNGHYCLGDGVVTDGEWYHGAATFDGESLKLYVDGKLQKQVVALRGDIGANTNDLTIGMNRSNPAPLDKDQAFGGALDEVMIFNHALTEAEVQAVIAAAKPKFTQNQVTQRLAILKELYGRGLLLKEFYDRKVKECEVSP